MKLIDYLNVKQNDIDTYDKDFDVIVTCCYISEEEFKNEFKNDEGFYYYYHFIKFIYENVEVIDIKNCICDWSGFVKQYSEVLEKFMKKYWHTEFKCDSDDFVYEWIKEIHYYLAGYTSESSYKKLYNWLYTHYFYRSL